MDFPNPARSAGNLVDSIRDKLNFGAARGNSRDAYVDEEAGFDDYAYSDEYDDYGDYGDYGFDDSYAPSRYDSYSDGYKTRDPYGSRGPQLVSPNDVRYTTSVYGVTRQSVSGEAGVPLNSSAPGSTVPGYLASSADSRFAASPTRKVERESEPSFDPSSRIGFDRPDPGYRDFVSPYQRSNAEKTQVMPSTGSSGLDGLFTPTDGSTQATAEPASAGRSFGGRFSRKIEIFEPKSFEEAADIARMLKEGSVVVLNLKNVNAGLSKRILDFSFGVVSALDAQINYEAPQVFSITQSGKLTLVEKDQLRTSRII